MWYILIVPFASFFNSVMDKVNFHYWNSVFNRPGFWSKWAGPESWKNKNLFENPVLKFLLRGPLVFLTDLWHFSQMLVFTAYQIPIAIQVPNYFALSNFWHFSLSMLVIKLIHGVVFEIFFAQILNKKIES